MSDLSSSDGREEAVRLLTFEFFRSVSFETGQVPLYERRLDLFTESGLLIKNSGSKPETSTVRQFIEPRQAMVGSGDLTRFHEVAISAETQVFGHVAHRFSVYAKSGTLKGIPFEGREMIFTPFVPTPEAWKMSAMAWDDERPGLSLPEHHMPAMSA